jgi:hypothetical protein
MVLRRDPGTDVVGTTLIRDILELSVGVLRRSNALLGRRANFSGEMGRKVAWMRV